MAGILVVLALLALYSNLLKARQGEIETFSIAPAASPSPAAAVSPPDGAPSPPVE
jgi:hypothetical protein